MQQSTDAYVTFLKEIWWLFGSLFTLTYLFFSLPFLEEENGLKTSVVSQGVTAHLSHLTILLLLSQIMCRSSWLL